MTERHTQGAPAPQFKDIRNAAQRAEHVISDLKTVGAQCFDELAALAFAIEEAAERDSHAWLLAHLLHRTAEDHGELLRCMADDGIEKMRVDQSLQNTEAAK